MKTKPNDKPTIESVAAALLSKTHCRGDLLACLPYGKREALAFIKKHHAELEAATGRKLTIQASEYIPSGRGAFGRARGGKRAASKPAAVFWG